MKKEQAESLRYMQSHPTTGTPHNQQVISSQVETIFAIDALKEQLEKLNEIISSSEIQNQKLELSNYRLQQAMFVLTAITTGVVIFPIMQYFSKIISPYFAVLAKAISAPVFLVNSLLFLTPIIVSFISIILTWTFQKKFSDSIHIKDSIKIVLKDKEGNLKESCKNE